MTNVHIVMRPIHNAGGLIPSGTPVIASQWRNTEKLVAQRFLRVATPEEAAAFLAEPSEPEKPTAKKKGVKDAQ